jgi:cytochrome c oxidase subunit 4
MTATAGTHSHEETVHGAGRAHPGDRTYVLVALILALVTAAEVVTFYVEDTLGRLMVPVLLVMMLFKFAVVALWFMHLRFDSIMFRRFFVTGIILATLVYMAAMVSMQVFGDDTTSTILNPDGRPAAGVPGSLGG